MNTNKKIITPILLILLLGLIGLTILGLQNRITLLNRAATLPVCGFKKATCSVNPADVGDGNFIIRIFANGEFKTGGPGDTSIVYTLPSGSFDEQIRCEVIGLTKQPDGTFTENPSCKNVVTNSTKCTTPTSGPTATNTPPPPTQTPPPVTLTPPPEVNACACTEGGFLDCTDRAENYSGDQGPGQIIIHPKYAGNACFACQWLVLRDETKEVARYDCSQFKPGDVVNNPEGLLLPTPTVIRLHQARGESCRQYTVSVIGTSLSGPTPTPEICGDCGGKTCCPTCAQIVKTGCGDFTDYQGNTFTCDFELDGGVSCPKAGNTVKVNILNNDGRTYDVDFDDIDTPSVGLSHRYDDAGVYDIALTCVYDGGTLPAYQTCKQTVTVGCGGETPTPDVTPPGACPVIKVFKSVCIYE